MKNILTKPSEVLKWCLLSAIVFVLLYHFYLIDIPEIIPRGSKIGLITEKVCFAFITSYIFYWVNVELKKKVDKENISPYLAKKTYFIIQQTKDLFAQIAEKSGNNYQHPYPSKEELEEALKKVPDNSAAPLISKITHENGKRLVHYLNWTEYLYNYRNEVLESTKKIISLIPHLETEHVKALNDIEECGFFKSIATLMNVPVTGQDLSYLASSIYDCFQRVKSLEEYYDEKLKTFSPGYAQSKS